MIDGKLTDDPDKVWEDDTASMRKTIRKTIQM